MAVKVGDVVAWKEVPNGAVVLGPLHVPFVRRGDYVDYYVDKVGLCSWHIHKSCPTDQVVTIIALNVPADATADDLRRLAEVFEVRQALKALPPTMELVTLLERARRIDEPALDWDILADRLHAAGWRPGMTAEDAARLLAEVRDGEG